MAETSHFRRGGRAPIELRVRWRRRDVGATLEQEGTTSDVGMGGAYVRAHRLPEQGERVVLTLVAPSAWDPLEIHAVVRWVREAEGGAIGGFGVEFGKLTEPQASALYDLLQTIEYAEPRR